MFALLLGYSRIPYAAAQDGCFFKVFGKLHPEKQFPHISLLCIGALSMASSFLSLQTVIDALVTLRILVQFVGQIGAVIRLRKLKPDTERPFRMWLYPLPALAALVGWLFLFLTSGWQQISYSLLALATGAVAFLDLVAESAKLALCPLMIGSCSGNKKSQSNGYDWNEGVAALPGVFCHGILELQGSLPFDGSQIPGLSSGTDYDGRSPAGGVAVATSGPEHCHPGGRGH